MDMSPREEGQNWREEEKRPQLKYLGSLVDDMVVTDLGDQRNPKSKLI